MVKEIVPLGIRIPAPLKKQLKQAAKQNYRSMNAEIAARLDESFHPSLKSLVSYEDGDLVRELMRRYARGAIKIQIGKD